METKTQEEIQALKDSWVKDPCWDIEDTEGFESHKEELLAFHKEQREKWDEQRKVEKKERHEKVMRETGIDDAELAQRIYTFREIEHELSMQDRYIGEGSAIQIANATIAQAQVRATLLLAAQVKRVAGILENMDGRDSLAESVAIWKPAD